jgi:hypothetical protein
MLRAADANKKVLDQLQTDAAERRRHAQGGGGRLVAATACNVKPPFASLRRALWYELKKFWSAGLCALVTLSSMHCVGRHGTTGLAHKVIHLLRRKDGFVVLRSQN